MSGSIDVSAHAALASSGHAFAVCDAQADDVPLVWVNAAFEQLSGFGAADVVGRNCRVLQGPDTDRAATARIRAALQAGRAVTETLLNYRPDGSTWWNQVTITPVRDSAGRLTHFVGVQSDASERVAARRRRDLARADEDQAQAQRYADEHDLALALQSSLLPALPQIDGLDLAARYIPASVSAQVGGDWYDVLPLPDGSTGIAIGDVMGHDMLAAGAMGQLRSVLRSYAWEGQGPAEALDRLNRLVLGMGMAQLATCVYARLEPKRAERSSILTWSNAGHLPPLLRTPDGVVEVLREAAGVLIGVETGHAAMQERRSAAREVPSGSVLVLYTDGLVESRQRDIDEGIALLRNTLAADPADDVQVLADGLIDAAEHAGHDDDQCLLVVRTQ